MKELGLMLLVLGAGWCILAGFTAWGFIDAGVAAGSAKVFYNLAGGLGLVTLGYFFISRAAKK